MDFFFYSEGPKLRRRISVQRVWAAALEEKYLFLKTIAVLHCYKLDSLLAQLFTSNHVTLIKNQRNNHFLQMLNTIWVQKCVLFITLHPLPSHILELGCFTAECLLRGCQTVMLSDITKRNKIHLLFLTLIYTTNYSSILSISDFVTLQNLIRILSICWEAWKPINRSELLFTMTISLPQWW